MKTDRALNRHLVVVAMSLCFVFLLSVASDSLRPISTVAAQAKTTITKPKGLTLSPLRSELEIAPGTSLDGVLTVTNSTDKPMIVDASAEEFSVIDQQYDYSFTAESDVAKWVSFNPTEVNLSAGASEKIAFTVGVPLSAEPGGRYISLFASTKTGTSDDSVNSLQRVASLLYITVLGDVTRAGHLVTLTSPWGISANNTWSGTIQNTGTTHFRSRYNVGVKNILGDGVVVSASGDALILPGTVRLVSDILPAPQLPGIYKVVYTIGLGDTPAKTETRFILYAPPWSIFIIIAAATVLILVLWRKRKLSRR